MYSICLQPKWIWLSEKSFRKFSKKHTHPKSYLWKEIWICSHVFDDSRHSYKIRLTLTLNCVWWRWVVGWHRLTYRSTGNLRPCCPEHIQSPGFMWNFNIKSIFTMDPSIWCHFFEKLRIINARSLLRTTVRCCLTCIHFLPRLLKEVMGGLHVDRLQGGRLFLVSGVDFRGPFFIEDQRHGPLQNVLCHIRSYRIRIGDFNQCVSTLHQKLRRLPRHSDKILLANFTGIWRSQWYHGSYPGTPVYWNSISQRSCTIPRMIAKRKPSMSMVPKNYLH